MTFTLHPNLAKKDFVIDLPLCQVLLEDNRHYPWLFLVPKRLNVKRIMDLHIKDQFLLLGELDLTQNILWDLFQPEQLNVAAIGNKTPQLHIHVIARKIGDPAWPATVWDHPIRDTYQPEEKWEFIRELQRLFTLSKIECDVLQ